MGTRNRGEPDIPLCVGQTPAEIKRDVEALCRGIMNWSRLFDGLYRPRPTVSPIYNADTFAAYGVITRVRALEGQTIKVSLPPARAADGGRVSLIQRLGTAGAIFIIPIGATLNERASGLMLSTPGIVAVHFDGQNHYTDTPLAQPWGVNVP